MGKVTREIAEKLFNSKNIIINEKVDGNFPNHHPDPTVPKNMVQLIDAVKKNNCDIGLAFDGDGDRLGVIDNLGNIVWADQYMLLLCSEITALYDNPKIIMDVKCSKVFFDEAKKINCDPIMSRTGHSPIKEKMKELSSPLSGEMSGHVCYGDDFYGYDDAMYVGLRLLRILANQHKSLSELMEVYPKTFSTPETRFDVDESRKFTIIDEVKERLKNSDERIIDIDGVRVENDEGWFLMRASNTQNQLTCRAESTSENGLLKLIEIIEHQLSLSGVSYKFTI
jgi:phosphomannomutase